MVKLAKSLLPKIWLQICDALLENVVEAGSFLSLEEEIGNKYSEKN